jgi:hypothetical protein
MCHEAVDNFSGNHDYNILYLFNKSALISYYTQVSTINNCQIVKYSDKRAYPLKPYLFNQLNAYAFLRSPNQAKDVNIPDNGRHFYHVSCVRGLPVSLM